MTQSATETKTLIDRLTSALAVQIETDYLPEEMAEVAAVLPPLYQARAYGRLPETVEHVIGLIEKSVMTIPHFACAGCKAVFADTEDLGPSAALSHIYDAKTGEPAIGTCPVCSADVWPRQPMA